MYLDEIKEKITPVLEAYDVTRAALFGSIVSGEETADSDIDFLVEFQGRKSLLDLAGLKIDLEELLGREVDAITYKSLHPLLKDRILSEMEPVI